MKCYPNIYKKNIENINYQNLKKELAQYRFIFEKHPLLQNYLQYKKDVEQILQEVISVLTWE